ncbi:MAG: hypothetical protein ABSA01_07180 [Anaerolineales bacterium]|jgi:hypothetical protein
MANSVRINLESWPAPDMKSFAARKAITVENNSRNARQFLNPFPYEQTTDGCTTSKNERLEDASINMQVLKHFCALNGETLFIHFSTFQATFYFFVQRFFTYRYALPLIVIGIRGQETSDSSGRFSSFGVNSVHETFVVKSFLFRLVRVRRKQNGKE